jgi:tRNA nucleotidyltransferase (CCA-adding enzyme)
VTSTPDERELLAAPLPPRPVPRTRDRAALAALFRGIDAPALAEARRLAGAVAALAPEPGHPLTRPGALLVGGFVRDTILGLESKDVDVEVYGVGAGRLEALLDRLFSERVNKVGRAFSVFKVHLAGSSELDLSIPRRESSTGPGHRDFVVRGDPGLSPAEAARRRDFTCNALAADPLTGELLDAFDGLGDLERGLLCATDPRTFVEDPLRVYRAVQFAGRFGFGIAPDTHALLSAMVARGELLHLPRERVTEELRKLLLKSPRPSVGFELLRTLGILERHQPELAALVGCPQDPAWHPEGDVWTHTMMVLDAAAGIVRLPTREFTAEQSLEVLVARSATTSASPRPPASRAAA